MLKDRSLTTIILAILTVVFLSAASFILWRVLRQDTAVPLDIPPLAVGETPQALRLTIRESGIASVAAAQLRQAKLPVQSFSVDALQLTRDGRPIPFVVMGEGQAATLYFYAQAITHTLEAPAVYWLAPGQGLSMAEREARPTGPGQATGRRQHRWEDQRIFLGQAQSPDVWFGQLLFAPGSLDFPLDGIEPTGGPGQLTVRIWSNNQADANPDHHVELVLNGRRVADHFWEGIKSETISLALAPGLLQPAENTLTIRAPGDTGAAGEALYIDWIELSYESQLTLDEQLLWFGGQATTTTIGGVNPAALFLDVSDPARPIWLTGAEIEKDRATLATAAGAFVALLPTQALQPEISPVPQWPDALKDADQGADYVAIVANAEGFEPALQPLLDFRQQQGLRVRSVPLAQVYDEFSYGRQDPAAIRDFLAYAQANWRPPAPRFVLLVGDSSYDFYGFTESPNQDLLPTYLVYTEFAGYVASDTWFTMLDGDSLAPHLAIGRLPAQTARQLATMVNKTLAYEQATGSEWLGRALLVADDEPSFDVASEQLAGRLASADYLIEKLYMTEDEEIHDEIISALNQGVGILNYVGHGSIDVWGDERVLTADDTTSFFNRERLPIFTTFTCLNGYFNHPEVNSLAESLLWAPDGGVVAAVVPSGRSLPTQQLPLADVFYEGLLAGEGATLGEALQIAKAAAADDDFFADVIHTFNLLGDPALRFQLP